MVNGELVPRNNAELVAKGNGLYGVYEGITFFQGGDGAVAVGPVLDAKTLVRAGRNEISADVSRFHSRMCNIAAAGNVAITGGIVSFGAALGEGMSTGYMIYAGFITAALHATSYALPRARKKQIKALEAVSDGLTQIPSSNISVRLNDLSPEVNVHGEPVDTIELVGILQKMQVSHMTSEAASVFEANHKETIDPALVVKGGLLGLPLESRGIYLRTVFDNSQELHSLSRKLQNHAALSVTKGGREGLRIHTGTLLSHLGAVASSFMDLKAAQVLPKLENLADVADDPHFSAGLSEAQDILRSEELSARRYDLAVRQWGEAGTL